MAVAVESPFTLMAWDPSIQLSTQGTFVAGRRRTRRNNDPYGGEGYVWEDITVPTAEEEPIPGPVLEQESHLALQDPIEPSDAIAEQQSVATQRLDQIKQHLIDILPPPRRRRVEGFSMDNIHLGGVQEWQPPFLNCPRMSFQPRSLCNQEWQNYARSVLFQPQTQHMNPTSNHQTPPEALHSRLPNRTGPELRSERGVKSEKRQSALFFEQLDVHCSWSSLMAHRRREVAQLAPW